MLVRILLWLGLRSDHFHAGALASIVLCLSLWIRAKTVDQEERDNAERRALFVGLWPPMFWLIGDAVERQQRRPQQRRRAAGQTPAAMSLRRWSASKRMRSAPA